MAKQPPSDAAQAPAHSPFRDRIMRFEKVRVGDLVPHAKNWRGPDDPEQSQAVRDNLTEIGQVVPLCTYERSDGKLGIIDGHLRSGLDPDAVMWIGVTDLSEQEAEKELAALDTLAKKKPTDDVALAALLTDVQAASGLTGTGFDDGLLDSLLGSLGEHEWNAETGGTVQTAEQLARTWFVGFVLDQEAKDALGDVLEAQGIPGEKPHETLTRLVRSHILAVV